MPSSVWGIRESPLRKDNWAEHEGWQGVQQVQGRKASPRKAEHTEGPLENGACHIPGDRRMPVQQGTGVGGSARVEVTQTPREETRGLSGPCREFLSDPAGWGKPLQVKVKAQRRKGNICRSN